MNEQTSGGPPDLSIEHRHAARDGAFVVERGGERLAELTYVMSGEREATLEHTRVSEALRGQGVARKLVDAAVAWARQSGTRLVPVCTYAKKVLEHDEAFHDVLA
jgi:predicted GNAT family acetyltransferase